MNNRSLFLFLIAFNLFFLVLGTSGCKKKVSDDSGNILPSCRISSIENGQQIHRDTVIVISVEAADIDGTIEEVQFVIDGIGITSVHDFPYNYNWNVHNESLGFHTIKATSIDNLGGRQSDEITIEIIDYPPVALFGSDPNYGEAPLTVHFSNLSTNYPTSCFWDFGDGTSTTEFNPTHIYSDVGSYTVILISISHYGSDTLVKENLIFVNSSSGSPFIDSRDGQSYAVIEIGDHLWFAQNLNYMMEGSKCYDNDPVNCEVYGQLYSNELAVIACPSGWHLSSDEEWKNLEGFSDTQYGPDDYEWDKEDYRGYDAGKRLKSDFGWLENGNGTNNMGFNGSPGGTGNVDSDFFAAKGYHGYFWSPAYPYVSGLQMSRYMSSGENGIARFLNGENLLFSVRCVKD